MNMKDYKRDDAAEAEAERVAKREAASSAEAIAVAREAADEAALRMRSVLRRRAEVADANRTDG